MVKHVYDFAAPVRRPGALGWGDQRQFVVLLDKPQASFDEVVEGFQSQYPPCEIVFFQPRTVITINGEDTLGCKDRLFNAARRIADDDGHDRMRRLAGAE